MGEGRDQIVKEGVDLSCAKENNKQADAKEKVHNKIPAVPE